MDLDAGEVLAGDLVADPADGAEVLFGYNTDRVAHCVAMLAGDAVEGARLEGVDFDSVTADHIDGVEFVPQLDDESLVYDNQAECEEDGTDADPCTELGGGSIVIHEKGNGK
jgi:hypothetical protein